MSTDTNEAAERRLYAEVWAKHNLDVVDELVALDVVEHNPLLPGQAPGREGHRQTVKRIFSAFPDLQSTIEDLMAVEDKLAVRWTASSTHRGEFTGIPATNKQMTSEGIDIIRYEGGKRAEIRHQWDALGLMRQLGVIPAPRHAGK